MIWDMFGWPYYEDHLLKDNIQIKVGRFDVHSKITYRKYGEFHKPIKGQTIVNKNKIICYHRVDDANPVSFAPIFIVNKDSDGKLQLQELTSESELMTPPEALDKTALTKFNKDGKGAIPLLHCKTNPLLFESMMSDNSLKELKKLDESPLSKITDNIVPIAIIVIGVLAVLFFTSGGKI
jgi:hypothetical protein